MGFLGIIISAIGLVVGILMAIHIMGIAHMDLWPLWVGLTMGAAVGCAFLFNVKVPSAENK